MKLLTLARDLQRRKARERQQLFVAEGVRTVESLLASGLPVQGLLVADDAAANERVRAALDMCDARRIAIATVSARDLQDAADTESPQGILAIAPIPSWEMPSPPFAEGARFLVLDALQDPGNVGTVVRTAAAMGVRATFALPGTVDVWNAKVVRGSMGALFTHPVHLLDWTAVAGFMAQHEVTLWAADMAGTPLPQLRLDEVAAPQALIVSNEGAGLTPAVAASVQRTVAVPMAPGVESLNVGVATGILLYAMAFRGIKPGYAGAG